MGSRFNSDHLLARDIATGLINVQEFARAVALAPSGGLVGPARREATVKLAARALLDNVPGDFVETGTYNGGTAVLMLKTMIALDTAEPRRHFWGFDSFEGLPAPNDEDRGKGAAFAEAQLPTAAASKHAGVARRFKSSEDAFKANLRKNDVWRDGLVTPVKGWFRDTLPRARASRISFLRLDGDLYKSTMEGLTHLYPKLSAGGYVYIDDYGSFEGCKRAVNRYRAEHNVTERIWPIFEDLRGRVEAIWWRKLR